MKNILTIFCVLFLMGTIGCEDCDETQEEAVVDAGGSEADGGAAGEEEAGGDAGAEEVDAPA